MYMDETLERIITIMKEKYINDYERIDYLGLPHGTFSNWRSEKGRSYYAHIGKISDRLDVSINI